MIIVFNRKITSQSVCQDALNHFVCGEYVRAVSYTVPKGVMIGKRYKLTLKINKVVNCIGQAEVVSMEVKE